MGLETLGPGEALTCCWNVPSGELSQWSAEAQGARCVPGVSLCLSTSEHSGTAPHYNQCLRSRLPPQVSMHSPWGDLDTTCTSGFWTWSEAPRDARANLDLSEGGARWNGERAGRDRWMTAWVRRTPGTPTSVLAWEPVERRWLGKLSSPLLRGPAPFRGPSLPRCLPRARQHGKDSRASPRPAALVWEGASYELILR